MSGGHWGYLGPKISQVADDLGDGIEQARGALRLLAAIEHTLDWGLSFDTCYECAKIKTIAVLEQYFDEAEQGNWSAENAIMRLHNYKRDRCAKCIERSP